VQTTRHNHEGRSGKKEVQEEEEETTVIFVFSIPLFFQEFVSSESGR
jgi:hypothetical protein